MKGPKSRNWLIVVILILGIWALNGCSEGPERPDNLPPEEASNPTPANLSTDVGQIAVELQWDCSDPEDDSILYSIYLGTEGNPPLLDSNITENNYYVDFLAGDMVYYWQIVARDSYGNQSISPIWSFTTGSALEFIYPLEVGYRWEYSQHLQYLNFDPPEIESEITSSFDFYSEVEIDSVLDVVGINVYRFYQYLDDGFNTYEQNSYYSNQAEGLFYYVSESTGGIWNTPAPVRDPVKFIFHGREYGSPEELFADLGTGMPAGFVTKAWSFENPLLSLSYPLQMESEWVYLHGDDYFYWIDKKVGGAIDVETPAGLFRCYTIQWLYDGDHDGNWEDDVVVIDYICAAGLIKRVQIAKDVIISTMEHPEGIGTADIMNTFELSGYSFPKND